MTYRSQMGEALYHPPQRLGLLLEACNPRIEAKTHKNEFKTEKKGWLTNSLGSPTKSLQHSQTIASTPRQVNHKRKVSHWHKVLQQGTLYVLRKTHLAIKSTIQGKEKPTLPHQQVPNYDMHLAHDYNTRSKYYTLPTRVGIMGNNHPKFPGILSCHTWSF